MYAEVSRRLTERRLPNYSGLIRYLSGESLDDSDLSYPSRTDLMKTARDIFVKFFWERPPAEDAPTSSQTLPEENESEDPPAKKSKSAELKAFLSGRENVSSSNSLQTSADIFPEIKRQFSSFDATKKLPPDLESILLALKSIPPTSVEAERAFSAAGLFVTKCRSRLGDNLIDDLCFLRHYFLRK